MSWQTGLKVLTLPVLLVLLWRCQLWSRYNELTCIDLDWRETLLGGWGWKLSREAEGKMKNLSEISKIRKLPPENLDPEKSRSIPRSPSTPPHPEKTPPPPHLNWIPKKPLSLEQHDNSRRYKKRAEQSTFPPVSTYQSCGGPLYTISNIP